MELNGKWMISFDEEYWSPNNFGEFDSKEEVMNFINKSDTMQIYDICLNKTGNELKIEDSVTVYIGKAEEYVPHIDVGQVIEDLGEQAYGEVGDYGKRFLTDVTKEQESELQEQLNSVLKNWLSKNKFNPTFYKIVDIEAVTQN